MSPLLIIKATLPSWNRSVFLANILGIVRFHFMPPRFLNRSSLIEATPSCTQ